MANVAPDRLILRCYGYQKNNRWIGICLNFNLAVEAESPEELRQKMHEVIESYIETVLDTEDKDSIPALLSRRAPLYDWIIYGLIKFAVYLIHLPKKFAFNFKETIPFHLAHSC